MRFVMSDPTLPDAPLIGGVLGPSLYAWFPAERINRAAAIMAQELLILHRLALPIDLELLIFLRLAPAIALELLIL